MSENRRSREKLDTIRKGEARSKENEFWAIQEDKVRVMWVWPCKTSSQHHVKVDITDLVASDTCWKMFTELGSRCFD